MENYPGTEIGFRQVLKVWDLLDYYKDGLILV